MPGGIRVVISGSARDFFPVEAREEFAEHWKTACNDAQAGLDYTPQNDRAEYVSPVGTTRIDVEPGWDAKDGSEACDATHSQDHSQ